MPATLEEFATLHNRLISDHGVDAVSIGTMLLAFWQHTPESARAAQAKVLMPCVHARLREIKLAPRDLEAAMRDIDRANDTLRLLGSLDW